MIENKDFKYVMQDLTNLYIGARLSYDEIMDLDETPFKLKTIIAHYMLQEVMGDTTIANHIFYIEKNQLSYMVYKQMNAKFRMNVWVDQPTGKKKSGYQSEVFTIDEIVGNQELIKKKDEILVEEMHITKLKLLAVSI